MTPEQREQMNRLCTAIQQEKDPAKFARLIEELNTLLEHTLDRKVADSS